MSDTSKAQFEVVRGIADGWSVRRVGDPEAISWHETKEQAEEAARLQSDEGQEVDMRGDVFAEDPESAVSPKRTFMLAGAVALAVILLIVILSLVSS
jgi:hypothetical protein